MIVITGAAGHLGRLVLDALTQLVDPEQVVAGVRSPAAAADLAARGIVVREVDYDRPSTLQEAFDGADQVLLISSNAVGQRVAQHQAVIDAAAAANVGHLAYTSVLRAATSPLLLAAEHRATEEAIERSGLTTTILRNGWYIENYTENLAPALEHGTIVGAAGAGRVAAATRADYAQAAATVLTDAATRGRTYELAGQSFTMSQLAAAVTDALGRPIGYTDLTAAAYRELLVGNGVPAPFADILVDSDLGIAAGHLNGSSADLEHLIGRAPTTVEQALADAQTRIVAAS